MWGRQGHAEIELADDRFARQPAGTVSYSSSDTGAAGSDMGARRSPMPPGGHRRRLYVGSSGRATASVPLEWAPR
jgi:hypothetical protein